MKVQPDGTIILDGLTDCERCGCSYPVLVPRDNLVGIEITDLIDAYDAIKDAIVLVQSNPSTQNHSHDVIESQLRSALKALARSGQIGNTKGDF